MAVRTYDITITGTQPLLMHNDDIEWADKMEAWKADKDNKKNSKAGDDRTPPYRWIGALYHDGKRVTIPTENISRALMEGGAMVPVPGGKSGKTFKSQSQSGIMQITTAWPLLINGKEVPFISEDGSLSISSLKDEPDFGVHVEFVKQLGFQLFLKRARISTSKHIRVRPRFDTWSSVGQLHVQDDQITTDILEDILECAGTYKGLCDWRPGSKTPGTYGTFTSKVSLVVEKQKQRAA